VPVAVVAETLTTAAFCRRTDLLAEELKVLSPAAFATAVEVV
jgi:hypothetical protein